MTTARTMPGGYPDPGLFVAADISTPGGAQQVIDRVRERFGVLDILVHTVGGSHASPGGFATLSDAQWQDELNLNLLGAVRLDRGLLPAMIEAGSGVIVHVSSIQRRMPLYEATLGVRHRWRHPPHHLTAGTGHDAAVDIAGDFPGSPVTLTFHFQFAASGRITTLTIRP